MPNFEGSVIWLDLKSDYENAADATLTPAGRLLIRFMNGGWVYEAALDRQGTTNVFTGDYTKGPLRAPDGPATVRYFEDEEGIVIVGEWVENNETHRWMASLGSVPPDEAEADD